VSEFVKSVVLVAVLTVVTVVMTVVNGLASSPGEDMPTAREIPSFCEQLQEVELNQIQKCRPDDSSQPQAVRL
jgi:hypothetical protein